MLYRFMRPLFFFFEPETAHRLTFAVLNFAKNLKILPTFFPPYKDETKVLGLTFPNRIGLAAGLDKNGDCIDGLAQLGFGFIEIGTVTPLAQAGNPQPRVFRLPSHEALINRLGFNNQGLDALIRNVKKSKYRGILGISIGKNAKTTEENTLQDYLTCLEGVYPLADYIALNISSPNTVGLRKLQDWNRLPLFLEQLKEKQSQLQKQHNKYVPLLVKIAPDLTSDDIKAMGSILIESQMDGVIATNSTVSREGLQGHPLASQTGGLTGQPLTAQSLRIVRELSVVLQGKLPIIGSGGVMTPADAAALIKAGASLVQIYTGLIYKGPSLIATAAREAALASKHN